MFCFSNKKRSRCIHKNVFRLLQQNVELEPKNLFVAPSFVGVTKWYFPWLLYREGKKRRYIWHGRYDAGTTVPLVKTTKKTKKHYNASSNNITCLTCVFLPLYTKDALKLYALLFQ